MPLRTRLRAAERAATPPPSGLPRFFGQTVHPDGRCVPPDAEVEAWAEGTRAAGFSPVVWRIVLVNTMPPGASSYAP